MRSQQINFCVGQNQALGQKYGQIAYDALTDLRVYLPEFGISIEGQFETFNQCIRPHIGGPAVLEQCHLAKNHACDKRCQTHTVCQLHADHAALQKEQG